MARVLRVAVVGRAHAPPVMRIAFGVYSETRLWMAGSMNECVAITSRPGLHSPQQASEV